MNCTGHDLEVLASESNLKSTVESYHSDHSTTAVITVGFNNRGLMNFYIVPHPHTPCQHNTWKLERITQYINFKGKTVSRKFKEPLWINTCKNIQHTQCYSHLASILCFTIYIQTNLVSLSSVSTAIN